MATEYISRESAINEYCRNCYLYDVCDEGIQNQCPDIKGMIEISAADVVDKAEWEKLLALVEEANKILESARWISVSERLPEIWVKVLAFQPTFDEDARGRIRGAVHIGNGKWRETEHYEMMELPVTHWMPLPKPPKEVNDG